MIAERPKILCVDDELKNLDLYEAILDPRGFQVIRAKSGGEALERAMEKKVDLVLLDVMMRGIDGFETCRRLKADPATTAVPVVMITALDDQNSLVNGLRGKRRCFFRNRSATATSSSGSNASWACRYSREKRRP